MAQDRRPTPEQLDELSKFHLEQERKERSELGIVPGFWGPISAPSRDEYAYQLEIACPVHECWSLDVEPVDKSSKWDTTAKDGRFKYYKCNKCENRFKLKKVIPLSPHSEVKKDPTARHYDFWFLPDFRET